MVSRREEQDREMGPVTGQQEGAQRTGNVTKERRASRCVLSPGHVPPRGTGRRKGGVWPGLVPAERVTLCGYWFPFLLGRAGGTSHCGQRAGLEVGVALTDLQSSQDVSIRETPVYFPPRLSLTLIS